MMSGMDGINSLQKMLGALQVNETNSAGGTAAAASRTVSAAGAAVAEGGDHASLSLAGGLAASASDLSDVRTTKVAELRQAISNGTYNIPAGAVANKLLDSMLG